MATVFFSYSHKDESLRDELEIHLAMLKHQGVIDTWHDRRILAGDGIRGEINQHLESADIILLLVSPYFLASDYCYDKEMKRAMERHAADEARVIPVILRPCDWHSAPFGSLLATPTDGKPVTKYPDQHDAFLEITKAIRAAVPLSPPKQAKKSAAGEDAGIKAKPTIRSSNLRVKKAFTDHDKDAFLDNAFEYIANFFEGSLDELQNRNPGVTTRFRQLDANRFVAVVYRGGQSVGECTVRLSDRHGSRQITYSHQADSDNSYNEAFTVHDKGHSLFLQATGMSYSSRSTEELTVEGAAELYWGMLIEPLQR